jgi:two-component system, NarL family, response regulator DevR
MKGVKVTGPMAEIRIVLVDDHRIFRQGLRTMLAREVGLKVVDEAADAASALSVVERSRPHVVLLDLRLSHASESDGLALCRQLSERCPDSRVLVLTTFVEEWLVLEAIKQGAKGYLAKDIEPNELVSAIRAVHRGNGAFDAHSASAVVHSLNNGHGLDHPVQQMTPREREILGFLARGFSNVTIGQRLYISQATVKFHVGNVMRKLGVARRTEAVYVASKIGLV